MIAELRARGPRGRGDRARLRADARAVRALRDRAHGDRPPPRRRPRRQGARPRDALAGADPLGARPRVRPRARPRLQRRHGRRGAAADPVRDDVRLRVGDASSTTSTAAWRAAVVVPDAIPPERLYRYGAERQDPRATPGLKEEYYLADFEPDPAVLDELGARSGGSRSPSCARRRRSRSTTASRTTCSRRCSSACAARQTVVLPRTPEQRAELQRAGGFIVPERAIDAQSLIAYADLVVSAGGTMNREAVALGTPVLHGVRGPPRRRRRAADRRGPPAAAAQRDERRARQAATRRVGGRPDPSRPGDPHDLLLTRATRAQAPQTGSQRPRLVLKTRVRSAGIGLRQHASNGATSGRVPCYGEFRMLFRQIKTIVRLAVAATLCSPQAPPPAQAVARRSARTPPRARGPSCPRRSCTRRCSTPTSRGVEQARAWLLHGGELQEPDRHAADGRREWSADPRPQPPAGVVQPGRRERACGQPPRADLQRQARAQLVAGARSPAPA